MRQLPPVSSDSSRDASRSDSFDEIVGRRAEPIPPPEDAREVGSACFLQISAGAQLPRLRWRLERKRYGDLGNRDWYRSRLVFDRVRDPRGVLDQAAWPDSRDGTGHTPFSKDRISLANRPVRYHN